jgi:hypothetical protein
MKTRDEMVYDFMLALASVIKPEDLELAIGEQEDLEELDGVAVAIVNMAHALTRQYLRSL